MTLGSMQPGNQQVWAVAKDAINAISVGAICVPDTSITPNGYKQAPASASVTGPFVACVNKSALAAETAFSAAFPDTLVTVKGQGAIAVGKEVQCSASVSGAVAQFVATTLTGAYVQADQIAAQTDRLRVVGRYLGHENELTGKLPGTHAIDGETNLVIRLGGQS